MDLASSKNELVRLQKLLYTSKNPTRRWLHCTRRDLIIKAIRQNSSRSKYRDQHKQALEIGFGSGVYLPTLSELYEKVFASDIEKAYLQNATSLMRIYPNMIPIADNIICTRLPEASFDLILCSEVIEHIADSAKAISAMHRLLKPGGTLILSTPQRWCPRELIAKIAVMPGIIRLVQIVHREPVFDSGHVNLMTAQNVIEQLHNAGFYIREQFKSGVYLPLVAEFMGHFGLCIEQWLETRLCNAKYLNWLLWTQYYIAEA